ncbi:MAG: hypothetical protein FJ056_04460 [Cyanobacteria bacterium M_surface_10_m2_179]|nr:hypothetical protein [Cyanobacteria bacterium M_surface_10_m2_179]
MQTSPALRARLVHAEPGRRVVQVSAWAGSSCLGSALGEADTAEAAEERAISRLQQRLGVGAPVAPEPSPPVRHPVIRQPEPLAEQPSAPVVEEPAAPPLERQLEPPPQPSLFSSASEAAPPPTPAEPPADPDDWSDELAELDVQLQRLGWDRNQEGTYLQRAFGHPSRNRLTAYGDLVSYLRCLRSLPAGAEAATAAVPLRRQDLLEQSDQLLQSLRWDANQGRQLLEQQFQRSSRQQLSDEQLLQFNMLLEESLLQAG